MLAGAWWLCDRSGMIGMRGAVRIAALGPALLALGCGGPQTLNGPDDLRGEPPPPKEDVTESVPPRPDDSDLGLDDDEDMAAPVRPDPAREPAVDVAQQPARNPLGLSEAGLARWEMILRIARDIDANGVVYTFVPLPPDASVLGVVHREFCDEVVLRQVARLADRLRASGFVRVVCYPEFAYAFAIPPAGTPVAIQQPGDGAGWYCPTAAKEPQLGLCARSAAQCRGVQERFGTEKPACKAFETAYCTTAGDLPTCFATAEVCVDFGSTLGGAACTAKR